MKRLVTKIKPASGFARVVHTLLNLLLPLLVFVLVRIDFAQLAVALILLSKWRMFAVKPRHWPANLRSNGVDIIVGLSAVVFMRYETAGSQTHQLIWTVLYGAWLTLLKPRSGVLFVSIQAVVAQLFGLLSLYLIFLDAPAFVLVVGTWFITYTSARHFLAIFDEAATRAMSHVWAYFAAALTWLLSHWLLYYGFMPQVVLLLTIIGYSLGTLYYLHKTDRISKGLQRQVIFMLCAILVVIIIFSDWSDKTI